MMQLAKIPASKSDTQNLILWPMWKERTNSLMFSSDLQVYTAVHIHVHL